MDEQQHADATVPEPRGPDEISYASYEDGESLVICDRERPSAWIKSDVFGAREP
jgi:hypothetical protein